LISLMSVLTWYPNACSARDFCARLHRHHIGVDAPSVSLSKASSCSLFGKLQWFSALQICLSGCYTSGHLQADVHDIFAIFTSLGLILRGRVRASSMSFLRFTDKDISDLSSVMHILDLQLNPSPHMCWPTWLLVEPLTLWLVRLQEALEEYNCRFFESEFSSDPLAGSNCILMLKCLELSVAYCQCVLLGTSSLNFVLQSTSCVLSCIVTMFLL
jgi:hypothetical protein